MRKPVVLLALVLLALLGAMAAKGLLVKPPQLRSHTALGKFDAARAKLRLAAVLGVQPPHPADSLVSDQVRARLVSQLTDMGLSPIVRDQFACNELYKQRGVSCARFMSSVNSVLACARSPLPTYIASVSIACANSGSVFRFA